jgi:hypothetical protein
MLKVALTNTSTIKMLTLCFYSSIKPDTSGPKHIKGPFGLTIERDLYFVQKQLSEYV